MTNQQQWKMAWQAWRKNDWHSVPRKYFDAAKYADAGRPRYFAPQYDLWVAVVTKAHHADISTKALFKYSMDRGHRFSQNMIERDRAITGN